MRHIRVQIVFIFLFGGTVAIQAQQYQTGLKEGKRMYEDALRLKNDDRCAEAAPRFLNAYERFQATRTARGANHVELSTWEKRCIDAMIECNAPLVDGTYVHLSSQTLLFNEKGDELFVTVTTNARTWQVSKYPSWSTIRGSNDRLYVTCTENTETNSRKDVIVLSADGKLFEITVEQTTKSIDENDRFDHQIFDASPQSLSFEAERDNHFTIHQEEISKHADNQYERKNSTRQEREDTPQINISYGVKGGVNLSTISNETPNIKFQTS